MTQNRETKCNILKIDFVSISSTSEEVRDVGSIRQDQSWILVSISSTSEEVRDTLSSEAIQRVQKDVFPLVPLPKKCVTHEIESLG